MKNIFAFFVFYLCNLHGFIGVISTTGIPGHWITVKPLSIIPVYVIFLKVLLISFGPVKFSICTVYYYIRHITPHCTGFTC